MTDKRRTRFAPSPTGFMHIGNLRSALYTWLIAKSKGGDFILRIEDTDQERIVEGAVEIIYQTLAECGLKHDEGPDVGGPVGPYVQSERLEHYRPYAEKLIDQGKAYRCFCSKDRLEEMIEGDGDHKVFGYDRHCRELPEEEIQANLAAGKPYVIRQKMPIDGETTFDDLVYGSITVQNDELEDQVLIKTDGFPTYNFANVIDDHEMGITHVVRGSEYLSSAPKYNLLYEALDFPIPAYVHLPLILGTDHKKLSKRHGATSFHDLRAEGYLADAIINYMAFLGWSPGSDTREFFTLTELIEVFNEKNISNSPAVFDYQKLDWYNAHYLQELAPEEFVEWLKPCTDEIFGDQDYNLEVLANVLQSRVHNYKELPDMLAFFIETTPYDKDLFYNKKQKLDPELSAEIIKVIKEKLTGLDTFTRDSIQEAIMSIGPENDWKTGQVMAPIRWALSGQTVTPGGGSDLIAILGLEESIKRLDKALEVIEK